VKVDPYTPPYESHGPEATSTYAPLPSVAWSPAEKAPFQPSASLDDFFNPTNGFSVQPPPPVVIQPSSEQPIVGEETTESFLTGEETSTTFLIGEETSKNILTDSDGINNEIDKIDEAIADIDSAIKTSSRENKEAANIQDVELQTESVPLTTTTQFLDIIGKIDEEEPVLDEKSSVLSSFEQTETSENTILTASTESAKVVSPEETKQLLEQFKKNEGLYKRHPAQPAISRRFFEHSPEVPEFKIASLSRLRRFIKKNNMGGTVPDNDNICDKSGLECDSSSRYRTFDGTCNNLQNPALGSVNSPYRRLLPPAYGDGDWLPRGASEWSETTGYVSETLPSPRKISDVVFQQGNESLTESTTNTHMLMQWGQFIDHDMVSTSKSSFDCCSPEIRNLCRCFPVTVSEDDSFYSQFGKTCLDFTRSDHHCRSDLEHAEQFNRVSSFLDGSHIYGRTKEDAINLRGGEKRQRGQLMKNAQLPHFLPSKFDMHMKMTAEDKPSDFVAGDKRVETQASLTAIHNAFLIEHNTIAEQLFKELKPKSSLSEQELDELVFQEARRLVIAEIQHITYSEYLPQVIGESGIKRHHLREPECIYNPEEDPGMINSFITAAFRYGHSLIQTIFRGLGQPWRLGKFFADTRFAWGNGGTAYKNELVGLTQQPCQKADVHITKQMTQLLFMNNQTQPGQGHDIGTLNIQRGRDHGLPAYNKFREFCGLSPIQSMDGLPEGIDAESWTKIKSVYNDPNDIDLYVGGLAEIKQDGVVGPTFSCIIGNQFKSLMHGDRFFYHHTGGPNIFPLEGAAKREIEARTLTHILCEITETERLPQNAFHQVSTQNLMEECSNLKPMDLKAIAAEIQL